MFRLIYKFVVELIYKLVVGLTYKFSVGLMYKFGVRLTYKFAYKKTFINCKNNKPKKTYALLKLVVSKCTQILKGMVIVNTKKLKKILNLHWKL